MVSREEEGGGSREGLQRDEGGRRKEEGEDVVPSLVRSPRALLRLRVFNYCG
jgi:hypothetical protein